MRRLGYILLAIIIMSWMSFFVLLPYTFGRHFSKLLGDSRMEFLARHTKTVSTSNAILAFVCFGANFAVAPSHICESYGSSTSVRMLWAELFAADFNNVDNFYTSTPCGQPPVLRAGVLMSVKTGQGYGTVWAAWCLIFIITGINFVSRTTWFENRGWTDNPRGRRAPRRARRLGMRTMGITQVPPPIPVPFQAEGIANSMNPFDAPRDPEIADPADADPADAELVPLAVDHRTEEPDDPDDPPPPYEMRYDQR